MKPLLLLTILLAAFPAAAAAQEHPRAEIFGGYSYFRATEPGLNLNGWNASITGNFNSWLGVEADVSGHYGSHVLRLFGVTASIPGTPNVNLHSYMFGPRFAHRANDRVTPFGHVLFGATRAGIGAFGLSLNDTAFAALAGGGLDVKLSDTVALRAIQADYVVTRFGGEPQHNARLSFGLVLRFGP